MAKKKATVAKAAAVVTPVVEAPVVEVKAAEVVKEEVKAEVKAEAPKAEKKAAAKKETAKKSAAKKPAAKKETKETVITVQYQGNEVSVASIEEKVKAQFVAEGHRAGAIKDLNIYVKPEEFSAYYVINEGKYTGRVDLF